MASHQPDPKNTDDTSSERENEERRTNLQGQAQDSDRNPFIGHPYALAFALVAEDRSKLILYVLLVTFPGLLGVYYQAEGAFPFLIDMASTIALLFICSTLFSRWNRRLRNSATNQDLPPPLQAEQFGAHERTGSFLLLSLGFWVIWQLPYLISQQVPEPYSLSLQILLIPGFLLLLRFYYFFIPMFFGSRGIRQSLVEARTFTDRDWLGPIRCFIAPFGIQVLLQNLLLIEYLHRSSPSSVTKNCH